MKTFVIRVSLFLFLQLLIMLGCVRLFDRLHPNAYLAASIDKHARAAVLPSPRIILVGGSNLPFGIESDILERQTGLPVVNMGLHASLGLPYMLNEASHLARPGDVVVLSPEYDLLYLTFEESVIHRLVCIRPANIVFLSGQSLKNAADNAHIFFGGIARAAISRLQTGECTMPTHPYLRDGFNQYGDLISHYGHPSPFRSRTDARPLPDIEIDRLGKNMRLMQKFVTHCTENSVSVLFSFPPFPEPKVLSSAAPINTIAKSLSDCDGLTVIDTPQRHAYHWGMFYNTKYHLTEEGAALRTSRLAEDLRAWQAGTETVDTRP